MPITGTPTWARMACRLWPIASRSTTIRLGRWLAISLMQLFDHIRHVRLDPALDLPWIARVYEEPLHRVACFERAMGEHVLLAQHAARTCERLPRRGGRGRGAGARPRIEAGREA